MKIDLHDLKKTDLIIMLADIVEVMRVERRNIYNYAVLCDDLYQYTRFRADASVYRPGAANRHLIQLANKVTFTISLVPPGETGNYQAISIGIVEDGANLSVDVAMLVNDQQTNMRYQELCTLLQNWNNSRTIKPVKPKRRERNHRQRIIAGLIRWRNETAGDSIDDLTNRDVPLAAKQTYHNYIKVGLAYTTDDLAKLKTTFGALWSAYTSGHLEQTIMDILENVDET